MLAYVCLISLSINTLLCSIFDRSNLPLHEFGVKCATFISERCNVRHVCSCPDIAWFLVLVSNLKGLSANKVQFTELDISFSKYRRVLVFSCCMKHTCV